MGFVKELEDFLESKWRLITEAVLWSACSLILFFPTGNVKSLDAFSGNYEQYVVVVWIVLTVMLFVEASLIIIGKRELVKKWLKLALQGLKKLKPKLSAKKKYAIPS